MWRLKSSYIYARITSRWDQIQSKAACPACHTAGSCRDLCWDWRQVIFCPVFSNAKVSPYKMMTPALNSFPDGSSCVPCECEISFTGLCWAQLAAKW